MLALTKLGFCRGTYHDLADGEPDEIHLPALQDRRQHHRNDKRRWSDAESDGHNPHHHHNSSDDEWSESDEDESPEVAATRSLLGARQKQPFVREVYTMAQAEHYLIDSLDALFEQEVNEAQTQWMRDRVGANCLHKGDEVDRRSQGGGKRWLVAVDGSASAHRAWELMIKMVDPSRDHVMVVTVRDKDLPRRYGRTYAEALRLRYELWRWASHIIGPYARQLESFMDPSRYTIVVPESLDERNMLCEISRRYAIHTLVVGKHARAEHNSNHWRLRSLSSYVTKNAPVQKVLVL